MNKQRIITFIAILCFAQLAIITSEQLRDKDSDLHSFRAQITSATRWISGLFNKNQDTSQSSGSSSLRRDPLAQKTFGELTPVLVEAPEDTGSLPENESLGSRVKSSKLQEEPIPARDPFIPFFSIRDNSVNNTGQALTSYSLSELRVAAIVGDQLGNRSASVETSDGKSFIVKVGIKIGKNGGRIQAITETSIVISEPAESGVGSSQETIRNLSLKIYPTPPSGIAE